MLGRNICPIVFTNDHLTLARGGVIGANQSRLELLHNNFSLMTGPFEFPRIIVSQDGGGKGVIKWERSHQIWSVESSGNYHFSV